MPDSTSGRLSRTLERPLACYGALKSIRMDNGPEMTNCNVVAWVQRRSIAPIHIEPGERNQNAYIKRFNKTCHTEVLDATCSALSSAAVTGHIDVGSYKPTRKNHGYST